MRSRKLLLRVYAHLEALCLRSWWVFLFGFFCLALHERQGIAQREKMAELEQRWNALELEKFEAVRLNKELKHQLASQEDPEYMEMVLMRVLGVTPEGMQKVCFFDD